ncbi:polyhydroxybutyrate depolymerase [Candidatus Sumerlaeota bacterium]|nr:polyhydroxybutyrate depolymerase [Candidatus Sumerlaeota bacterium]
MRKPRSITPIIPILPISPLQSLRLSLRASRVFLLAVLLCCSPGFSADGPIRRAVREKIKEKMDARVEAKSTPGTERVAIQSGGSERSYLIHVPYSHEVVKGTALVIVLHGGGGTGAQAERSYGWSKKSDEEGFIVVYPDGTGPMKTQVLTWNAGNCCGPAMDQNIDDVSFIRAVIEDVEKKYKINPKKIYATGISNGGMMSYRLACELSGRIAAIGPVAGALNCPDCAPKEPVSVVAVHGTADKHVLYNGGKPETKFDNHPRVDKSVAESLGFWIKFDGCGEKPATETKGNITTATYDEGKNGTAVKLYTVKGGGHAWPGGDRVSKMLDQPTQELNATDVIWEFFKTHPKK